MGARRRLRGVQAAVLCVQAAVLCAPPLGVSAAALPPRVLAGPAPRGHSPPAHARALVLRGGAGDEDREAAGPADADLARQREERKKAKAEEKLRKKLAKEAARAEWTGAAAGPDVSYAAAGPSGLPEAAYGDLRLVQSRELDAAPAALRATMRAVAAVAGSVSGQRVWVRARVQSVRSKGNSCFLVLRQGADTVQATLFKGDGVSKDMLRFCAALPKESFVDVHGLTVSAQVASCSVADTEIAVDRLFCVSRSLPVLPLLPEEGGGAAPRADAGGPSAGAASAAPPSVGGCATLLTSLNVHGHSEREGDGDGEEGGRGGGVTLETRLNARVLDLRSVGAQAMVRMRASVSAVFRACLAELDFVEIHTPKLQNAAPEVRRWGRWEVCARRNTQTDRHTHTHTYTDTRPSSSACRQICQWE